jgi:hypothetical protein
MKAACTLSKEQHLELDHDGGKILVQTKINEDGTATIYFERAPGFGSSMSLRLGEVAMWELRELLHDTARIMTLERRDTVGA